MHHSLSSLLESPLQLDLELSIKGYESYLTGSYYYNSVIIIETLFLHDGPKFGLEGVD